MHEERVRIARDLHDVVAHTVTAMTVQAGVALDASVGQLVPVPGRYRGHGVYGTSVRVRSPAVAGAFYPADGVAFEDPVTGSLNAALGQWLAGSRLPEAYLASQGTAMRRRGRVHIERAGGQVWVGGDTLTTIHGTVEL